jgi:hypothetical protein
MNIKIGDIIIDSRFGRTGIITNIDPNVDLITCGYMDNGVKTLMAERARVQGSFLITSNEILFNYDKVKG